VPLNTKKRRGNFVLTKGHFGHQGAKGQVLEHPKPPPLHVPDKERLENELTNMNTKQAFQKV